MFLHHHRINTNHTACKIRNTVCRIRFWSVYGSTVSVIIFDRGLRFLTKKSLSYFIFRFPQDASYYTIKKMWLLSQLRQTTLYDVLSWYVTKTLMFISLRWRFRSLGISLYTIQPVERNIWENWSYLFKEKIQWYNFHYIFIGFSCLVSMNVSQWPITKTKCLSCICEHFTTQLSLQTRFFKTVSLSTCLYHFYGLNLSRTHLLFSLLQK